MHDLFIHMACFRLYGIDVVLRAVAESGSLFECFLALEQMDAKKRKQAVLGSRRLLLFWHHFDLYLFSKLTVRCKKLT